MLTHLQTDNIRTTSYTVNISSVSKSIKINIEKSIPFPNSILAEHLFTLLYCFVLRCMVVADSASPWTVAHQASLSMGFSWQEYWRVAVSSSRAFPCPGMECVSPAWQVDSSPLATTGKPSHLTVFTVFWNQLLLQCPFWSFPYPSSTHVYCC